MCISSQSNVPTNEHGAGDQDPDLHVYSGDLKLITWVHSDGFSSDERSMSLRRVYHAILKTAAYLNELKLKDYCDQGFAVMPASRKQAKYHYHSTMYTRRNDDLTVRFTRWGWGLHKPNCLGDILCRWSPRSVMRQVLILIVNLQTKDSERIVLSLKIKSHLQAAGSRGPNLLPRLSDTVPHTL